MKWFKLLLIDEDDLSESIKSSIHIVEARQLLLKSRISAVQAITKYLECLWAHTKNSIERAVGRALFNISRIHIVITLPAIWPHYAQMRMRQAAEAAGILAPRSAGETTLEFVPEPEAAALATMSDMTNRSDIELQLFTHVVS